MEERLLAFCGIDCKECPAYIATQQDDQEQLKKTAEGWSTPESKLTPEDIICDGCLFQEKRLASFTSECPVRSCAIEKHIENCGLCDDYPCGNLEKVWNFIKTPEAKERLDEIRRSHKS